MSSNKDRKATIIYGPSLADPGGDETPIDTAEDKKMVFDDLKIAMKKFKRKDERVYKTQLEALNNPKDRRQALSERMPALKNQTKEMAADRENVLNGLEMIDLLEQIDIIDTMIGKLGTLERQIQNQISIFIQKGCTIETLIGTPMKPHGNHPFWKVPPEDPHISAGLFLQDCRIINNLKKIMMRVVKLSDKAETEGTIWMNKLKKFDKKINFFDPFASQVFMNIAESLEEDQIQQLNIKQESVRLENEIDELELKIEEMDESATVFTLENEETLIDLYQKQKNPLPRKRGRPSKADKDTHVNMLIQIKKLEAIKERFEAEQYERLRLQKKIKKKKKLLNYRKIK